MLYILHYILYFFFVINTPNLVNAYYIVNIIIFKILCVSLCNLGYNLRVAYCWIINIYTLLYAMHKLLPSWYNNKMVAKTVMITYIYLFRFVINNYIIFMSWNTKKNCFSFAIFYNHICYNIYIYILNAA